MEDDDRFERDILDNSGEDDLDVPIPVAVGVSCPAPIDHLPMRIAGGQIVWMPIYEN